MVHYEPLQPKGATRATMRPSRRTRQMQPPGVERVQASGPRAQSQRRCSAGAGQGWLSPTRGRPRAPRTPLALRLFFFFPPPDRRCPARAAANLRLSRRWEERPGGRGAVSGPPAAAAAAAAAPLAGPGWEGGEWRGGGRDGDGSRKMEAASPPAAASCGIPEKASFSRGVHCRASQHGCTDGVGGRAVDAARFRRAGPASSWARHGVLPSGSEGKRFPNIPPSPFPPTRVFF